MRCKDSGWEKTFFMLFFLACSIGCGREPTAKPEVSDLNTPAVSSSELIGEKDKNFLLRLARQTLKLALANKPPPEVDLEDISPLLKEKRGCFVTLEKNHNLRGCIGYLQPRRPLWQAVTENVINAAFSDPRFRPVKRGELDFLTIEISVLTVPRLLAYKSPEELLQKLVPERDGVILKGPFYQSTFLPQVWKQIPEKEEFLSKLCLKGGAGGDCWKDSQTQIYLYQAQVFSEPN